MIYFIILLVTQFIIFYKLNKLKQMAESAQAVLDQFKLDLEAARDAIIARINAILEDDGSDLTAEEVRERLTGIRDDLSGLGNPPA